MATINGTPAPDLLNGTSASDTLNGFGGDDSLSGRGGDDSLVGAGGDDTLSGGGGDDALKGGSANDTYVVDSPLDSIVESVNSGIDTVKASIGWTLRNNLENLVLTGAQAINGYGNRLDNVLSGNSAANLLSADAGNDTLLGDAGNDTLIGGVGADSMSGGVGSDTYIVNDAGDVLNELPSQGIDLVKSSVNWTLAENFERLVLVGAIPIDGTGNQGDNLLKGNGGANVLDGGEGVDRLFGAAGNDSLIYDAADGLIDGGAGVDTLVIVDQADWSSFLYLNEAISGIEQVELSVTGGATLRLDAAAVLRFSDTDTLLVKGGAGDAVQAFGAWGFVGSVEIAGHSYAEYARDGATMQIDMDIDRSGISISSLSLHLLDGTNGFSLSGVAASDSSGRSVSAAGDVNGDGIGDLIVGAYHAGADSGASYVVFGTVNGTPAKLDLSALDGANGFAIHGAAAGDYSGFSVAAAGDINNDGFDDVVVGAPHADANGTDSGASYVVFGAAAGFDAVLELSNLAASKGFRLSGAAANDNSGISVDGAGDVNGDGYADLVIGAWSAEPHGVASGASYVVFGAASGFGSNLNLSDLNGANGFRLSGVAAGDHSGVSVSSAGDVNGDGFGDLVVGASGAESGDADTGAAFLVFGAAGGFGSNVDLASLNGSDGLKISGVAAGDYCGFSVSAAGDVNGDGYDDLILGARRATSGGAAPGASYVVFGSQSGFSTDLDLSALDGENGFKLAGVAGNDDFGCSVSAAGDLNGDGCGDLIVGASTSDPGGHESGAGYVLYGSRHDFPAVLELSILDGSNGFRLDGAAQYDYSGYSVSGAIDVNGDGFDDVILGAKGASPHGAGSGSSYVVFGSGFPYPGIQLQLYTGTSGDDTIDGGSAGSQVIYAGAGDDRIELAGASPFRIDGGGGVDTVAIDGMYSYLNLDGMFLSGIEKIDLEGSAANQLYLTKLQVVSLSDSSNTLLIKGDGEDSIILDSLKWIKEADILDPQGETGVYSVWKNGAATLMVESDVAVTVQVSLHNLNGLDGFAIDGGHSYFGYWVSDAGDLNRDGFGDLVFGSFGSATVMFGAPAGRGASHSGTALDGADGFRFATDGPSHVNAVSGAGDVNGDGFDDLIVGSSGAAPHGVRSGASYVIFGAASGFAAILQSSDLDGTNGFKLSGVAANDWSGYSVAGAGDVNGDGFDDVIVGARFADPHGANSGASYVFFGKEGGFAANFDLSGIDGTNGFKISGEKVRDFAGFSVSGAGDFNGDGFDDVIIGASGYSTTGIGYGLDAAYVVFGHASGFTSNLNLSALNGSNGFKLAGVSIYDLDGWSVSSAGDLNGDGFDDLAVGAPDAYSPTQFTGACYVVFGAASGFGPKLELSGLNGVNGFKISGRTYEKIGYSVSSAGDVNGDGFGDLILGSQRAYSSVLHGPIAYVVFGSASGFGANIVTTDLEDGGIGFVINGSGTSNLLKSVSGAGDVNGDGFDDLVVGAPNRSAVGSDAAYIVYGGNFSGAVQFIGGTGNDNLVGTGAGDGIVGGTGDDTIAGGYGKDVLAGGAGADTFLFDTSPDTALNFDHIRDFRSGEDHIALDGSVFVALDQGAVLAKSVQMGLESSISDVSGNDGDGYADYLKYATNTGHLYYDSNGTEAGGLQLIAKIITDTSTPAALHFFPSQDIVVF